MGYILETKCNSCNEIQRFQLGQSLRDCKLEEVLLHFQEKEQQKIKELIDDYIQLTGEAPLWNYEKKLGYCTQCNKLIEVPTITIFINVNRIVIEPPCECGEPITIIMDSEQIERKEKIIYCPCKKGTLEYQIVGMWD